MFFKQSNNFLHLRCHVTGGYIVSVTITISISRMMAMGVLTSKVEHRRAEPKISCGPLAYFGIDRKQMRDNPTPA
jgi:hypothetical protein